MLYFIHHLLFRKKDFRIIYYPSEVPGFYSYITRENSYFYEKNGESYSAKYGDFIYWDGKSGRTLLDAIPN